MIQIATIRLALAELPAVCRYHGTNFADPERRWGSMPGACCDTGAPSLRRHLAEQALADIEEQL